MITNETEYHAALKRIEQLVVLDPDVETREGKELAELSVEVAEYERE